MLKWCRFDKDIKMATVTGRVREYSSPCEGICSCVTVVLFSSLLRVISLHFRLFSRFFLSLFFFLFRFIFTLLRTNGKTVIHIHPPGYTRNIIGKKKSAQGREKKTNKETKENERSKIPVSYFPVLFSQLIYFSAPVFFYCWPSHAHVSLSSCVCLHVGEFAIACRSDRTQQSPKLFSLLFRLFQKG